MIDYQANADLRFYNSLRLPARCRGLVEISTTDQLVACAEQARRSDLPLLVLGGGSNVVFAQDYPGLCAHMATRGISAQLLDAEWVEVRALAGEPWHPFVDRCMTEGWYGLENLALIPGSVGAAPIQNIGAYGVEVKDFISAVEVLELDTGRFFELDNANCRFGYRDSIFKGELKDRVAIVAVRFRLRRQPRLMLDYQGVAAPLAAIAEPTPRDLFDAVVRLRQQKLPDPDQLPNAGSFFKNPVVSLAKFAALQQRFPRIVAYPDAAGMKLAAGWLIDQAGWKGFTDGAVGVHEHQALVLVHHGGGSGAQLLALAERIRADIHARYGVSLEIEPRIY